MTRNIILSIVTLTFLSLPAGAVDLLWTDYFAGQVLRGTVGAAGQAQILFDITDYPGSPTNIAPLGIAFQGDYVYWSDNSTGQILRGGANGTGGAQVLFDISDYPNSPAVIGPAGLAVSGDYIYWTDSATGEILRGKVDGTGAATSLYGLGDYPGMPTENGPWAVAVAEGGIYWSDSDTAQILRGAVDGSSPAEAVLTSGEGQVNQGLALEGGYVYWCDIETDVQQGRVLRGLLSGAEEPEVLFGPSDYPGAPDEILPVSIAASGGILYWSDASTRQVLSAAADGSDSPVVLFDMASFPGSAIPPAFLAVVTTSYSADYDGDGDVDGRDFLIWQRGQSPASLSVGDLQLWKEQYGTVMPLATVNAVPEPVTAITLLSIWMTAIATRWRR